MRPQKCKPSKKHGSKYSSAPVNATCPDSQEYTTTSTNNHEAFQRYWNAEIVQSTAIRHQKTVTPPCEVCQIELTLFVSCYNEAAFIEDTLNTIIQALDIVQITYEIIVIDDCSKDHSADIVRTFIANHPHINISLRINKTNKGLAQNYIDGAFIGCGKYYRLICGDNAEPIETITKVLKMIGSADIIVPYYVSAEGKSAYRRFISHFYTTIVNWVSGNKLNYYNGLQVHLRHNVMRWHPNTRGFGFQAGLLCLLLDMGFTYQQVSCITVERRGGDGNALTLKNLRSVVHILGSIILRRIAI
ncbi:MAG: glycosyltransferase family 2 protein [Gammaproteobacteria bacterium]|nr:glycosyltransferase family 2 protein [Gammaproteobacteria bacterium]